MKNKTHRKFILEKKKGEASKRTWQSLPTQ